LRNKLNYTIIIPKNVGKNQEIIIITIIIKKKRKREREREILKPSQSRHREHRDQKESNRK
jgi:tryptophanase